MGWEGSSFRHMPFWMKTPPAQVNSFGPTNPSTAILLRTPSLLWDMMQSNFWPRPFDRAGSSDPEAIFQALGNTSGFSGVTGDISYQDDCRIPNKDVTIVSLIDGEIADLEVMQSTNMPLISG